MKYKAILVLDSMYVTFPFSFLEAQRNYLSLVFWKFKITYPKLPIFVHLAVFLTGFFQCGNSCSYLLENLLISSVIISFPRFLLLFWNWYFLVIGLFGLAFLVLFFFSYFPSLLLNSFIYIYMRCPKFYLLTYVLVSKKKL